MPKDLTKETVNTGRVVYEWLIREYEQYARSRRWYFAMSSLGLLLIIFALFTQNYLFALIIIIFGIVLYLQEMQPPLDIYFAITETGIVIGRKFYSFNELKGFWIVYNPPEVKNLYFNLNNVVRHRLKIPLLDYDPRPIKEFISQYLEEDILKTEEPLSDRLARVFKIH